MKEIRLLLHNAPEFALWSAIILPCMCLSMYSIALYYDHIDPIFPYVSDAASNEPQVLPFFYLTVLIWISISLTAYARYHQVNYYIEAHEKKRAKWQQTHALVFQLRIFNLLASVLMSVSSFGSVIAGYFNSNEWLYPHCVGVGLMCFMSLAEASSIIICAKLSSELQVETYPITMSINFIVQFIAGFLCGVLAAASIVFSSYAESTSAKFRFRWNATQGGYWCHVSSAVFEWVAINANSVFMLCLYARMKRFQQWHSVWKKII